MIGYMAKKKKPGRGRPKTREETFVVQARVDAALFDALAELAERGRRSKNAELVIALENHARAAGLWPKVKPAEGEQ